MFSCQVVSSSSVSEKVYNLRYRVYIQEMSLPNSYVDHSRQWIMDPRDRDGVLFASYENEELIGTALGTPATSEHLGEYVDLYQLNEMDDLTRTQTFIFSMLIFSKGYRGSYAVLECVRTVFRYFFERNFRFCLLHCYPSEKLPLENNVKTTNFFVDMAKYCKKYGFVELRHASTQDIDDVVVMRIDLLDIEHLSACHSPLLSIVQTGGIYVKNEPNTSTVY